MAIFPTADIPDLTGKTGRHHRRHGRLWATKPPSRWLAPGPPWSLTGRNAQKGADALARIRAAHPGADIAYEMPRPRQPRRVAAFASELCKSPQRAHRHPRQQCRRHGAAHAAADRQDGFELQFEHQLSQPLRADRPAVAAAQRRAAARVVSLSSIAARQGRSTSTTCRPTRLHAPSSPTARASSPCLMFALRTAAAQRRRRAGASAQHDRPSGRRRAPNSSSTAPAATAASLPPSIAPCAGLSSVSSASRRAGRAAPDLCRHCARAPQPGGYYGPTGFLELRGTRRRRQIARRRRSTSAAASRLWDISEDLLKMPVSRHSPAVA